MTDSVVWPTGIDTVRLPGYAEDGGSMSFRMSVTGNSYSEISIMIYRTNKDPEDTIGSSEILVLIY
jgi:hypothetical protein